MKKVCLAALLVLMPYLASGATELERLSRFVKNHPGATGSALPLTLGQLLATIRRTHPEAEVTGRFYDPRSVSIYRSRPGLHYGYDVALPAGTVVPAAWPGEVAAVTPWFGEEMGISVITGQREATYGHLIPLVRPGQQVAAGEPLGIVARDHVDVKMRGPAGEFIDFGAGQAEFATSVLTPEQRNRNYLLSRYEFLKTGQQLAQAQSERRRLLAGDDELSRLRKQEREYARLYQDGALARLEYEAVRNQLARVEKTARSKPARLQAMAARIADLQSALKRTREQLLEASRGVDVAAAGRYLEAYLRNHPTPAVAAASSKPLKLPPLRPDLDELLAEGVISLEEYRKMGGRSH